MSAPQSNVFPFSNILSANQVRAPRAIVYVNGQQIIFESLTVTTTTFYMADSFVVRLPLNGQPFQNVIDYWASAPVLSVKIYIGFPPNPDLYNTTNLDLLMVGNVDDININP